MSPHTATPSPHKAGVTPRTAGKRLAQGLRTTVSLLLMLLVATHWAKADTSETFASLPQWHSPSGNPRMGAFDCAGYAALAASLQKAGLPQATAQLRSLAAREDGLKVVPLCRLLFKAKPGASFRGPRLGGASTCPRTDGTDWPLDPIAVIDGVPFLVAAKYGKADNPESAADYLAYCLAECEWVTESIAVPDKAMMEAAFAKLREQIGGTRKGTWELYFRGQMKPAK